MALNKNWILLSALVLCMGWAHADEASAPAQAPLQSRLGLLEVLRLTLSKNPDIQLHEKQLEMGQGSLQQAAGKFDSSLGIGFGGSVKNTPLNQSTRDNYDSLGYPFTVLTTNTTSTSLTMKTPLRNGVELSTNISSKRTTGTSNDVTNFPVLTTLPSQSVTSINFTILVPLLKGGGDAAAAGERSAQIEWQARKQDLSFSISQDLLNSVTAYWNLLAANKILWIARNSEAGARQMVEQTRVLIEADERPAAELNVLDADLLDRASTRISAEQSLLDARLALGQAIGLPYPQIVSLEAADDFPYMDTDLSTMDNQLAHLIELGMKHRADHAAALLRQESAKILLDAAQNNLKPQFNLNFSVGYSGLAEGVSVSNLSGGLIQNRSGLNKSAQLSYQLPFENNEASGLFHQQLAAYDESKINVGTAERSLAAGIRSALSNLVNSALKLKKSMESVKLYQITLENEKNKHKLGIATINDVLTTNDRLFKASINNISYQQNYLKALAQLMYQTGTLFSENLSGHSFSLDQFTRAPKFD